MTKPNTKRKLGIENGKTPFLGPGWGQRFVAHRVSGGSRFAFTDKPRQGRQAGGVSKNMVPNTHGFLPPLPGLAGFYNPVPTADAVGYKSTTPAGRRNNTFRCSANDPYGKERRTKSL